VRGLWVQDASGSGRQRHLLGHTGYVCALAFSADGSLLASTQEGRQAVVRLWDWKSGDCLAVLCGEQPGITA
jgi:WD40 repeat protein